MKFLTISGIFCLIIPLVSISLGENIELSDESDHQLTKRSATRCYYTETRTRYVTNVGSKRVTYYYRTYYYTFSYWLGLKRKSRTVTGYRTDSYTYTAIERYTGYVYYPCYNGATCGAINQRNIQCICPKGWSGLSCDSAYPTVISAVAESLGTFINPSPYKFTCKISEARGSTIKLTVDGTSYTEYYDREVSRTLDLQHVTPGQYQFTCYTYNSHGSDSLSETYTIREGIPTPFSQFDYLPQSGEGCNSFQLAKCVDAIFLIDVSSLTELQLDRIADLGGDLPISTLNCENRYGLTVFGVPNISKTVEIANNTLFGGRSQLKSAILNTKSSEHYGPSDGYAAINKAVSKYQAEFRTISQRVIILFTNKYPQHDSANAEKYTSAKITALLADNNIILSVVTNAGSIYHYTYTPVNKLIGMNFNKYIGFGNFSDSQSSEADVHVVPNPHYSVNNTSAYESYVILAWDTSGSVLDISYFDSLIASYSSNTMSNLFSFAVLQIPSCQLADTYFNIQRRRFTSHFSIWTDIQPQIHTDCVDMVFLIDKSVAFFNYIFSNTVQELPEEGYSCKNRYGLVSYGSSATIFHLGGRYEKFGTRDQLLDALRSLSFSYGTGDIYVGISEIIESYSFRNSFDVRKHIVLFTAEDRDISSSLTSAMIINALRDNSIIFSVITNGAAFHSFNSQDRLVAVSSTSKNKVGFRYISSFDWKIEALSLIDVDIISYTTNSEYTELVWITGGIAFDLNYFQLYNIGHVFSIFNTLMFSWGTYVPIRIVSLTSDIISQHVLVNCTTNKVPGVSISLIIDGQRYKATDVNSLNVSIPLSIWNGTSPNGICIAKNSIGADWNVIDLRIKIPTKAPQNLSLTSQSYSDILAEWNDPHDHETEGIPLQFRITYQGILFDTNMKVETTSENRIVLTQLKAFTVYRVFIQTITTLWISNQSEAVMGRTLPAAPEESPQNVISYAYNATSIQVAWYPPPSISQNGILTSYKITIKGSPFDTNVNVFNIPVTAPVYPLTTEDSYLITHLHPYNEYTISVAAVNSAGESAGSFPINRRTFQTFPTQAPQNVSAVILNSTSALISWYPPVPDQQHGPIRSYTLVYVATDLTGMSSISEETILHIGVTESYPLELSSQIEINNLRQFTNYTLIIFCMNDAGLSANTSIHFRTPHAEPIPAQITVPSENLHFLISTVSEYELFSMNQSCIAKGLPTPSIIWTSNIGIIEGPTNHTLTIEPGYLSAERFVDEYIFTCTANNTVGRDIIRITVVIKIELVAAPTPILKRIGYTYVDIIWSEYVLSDYVSSFEICVLNSDESKCVAEFQAANTEYSIKNLMESTGYNITIVALTRFGRSPVSDTLFVHTNNPDDFLVEPKIEVPAGDTHLHITSTVQLDSFSLTQDCDSTGVPPPTISWISNTGRYYFGNILKILPGDLNLDHRINPYIFTCIARNSKGEDSKEIRITINIDVDSILAEKNNITDADILVITQIISVNTLGVNVTSDNLSAARDSIDNSAQNLETLISRYINDSIIDVSRSGAIKNLFIPASEIIRKDIELSSRSEKHAIIEEGVPNASRALKKTLNSVENLASKLVPQIDATEESTKSVTISHGDITIVAQNIVLSGNNSDITFPDISNNTSITERIEIPNEVAVLLSQNNHSLRIATTIVRTNNRIKSEKHSSTPSLSSNIVSVVVPDNKKGITNLPKPIKMSIPVPQVYPNVDKQKCAFLKQSSWSTQGLTTIPSDKNLTYCYTDHLTSFAVFVTPRKLEGSEDLKRVASIISYVLVSISFIFLIISLILFLMSAKTFFKVEANIIYFNYALAMTLAFGLFLVGIETGTINHTLCVIIAFLLHYLWLAVFVWTLCNGILIIYKLTLGILRERKIYPFLIVFGWISPIIIPIITIAIKHNDYVKANEHCFLTYENGLIWAFIGPILILLLINMIILIIATIRIATTKFGSDKFYEKQALRKGIISALILTPLLGIPWLLLLLNIFIANSIVQWSFIIVNGLMGVFFFATVTLRNSDVKKLFFKITKDSLHTSTTGADVKLSEMLSSKFRKSVSKDLCEQPTDSRNTKCDYVSLEPVSSIQEHDLPTTPQLPSMPQKARKLKQGYSSIDSPNENEGTTHCYVPNPLISNSTLKDNSPEDILETPIYEVISEELPSKYENIADVKTNSIVSDKMEDQNLDEFSEQI